MINPLLSLGVLSMDYLISFKQIPTQGLALTFMFCLACIAHGQDNTENIYFELPPGF